MERYGYLRSWLTGIGGEVAILGKSVFFFCVEKDSNYGFRKGMMRKRIGDNEECIFGSCQAFGAAGKREVVGMSIAHVCDLLISVPGAFIAYLSCGSEMSTAFKFLREMRQFTCAWG